MVLLGGVGVKNQNQTPLYWQKYQSNRYWWGAIDNAFNDDNGRLSFTFEWAMWKLWE